MQKRKKVTMLMNKNRILLADDEQELTRAVKIVLEHNGYIVDVVENGLEVLEKIKTTSYNVIILDIMMPKLDGITTIKEMRMKKVDTPVLFLSAKALIDDKVMGLDAGANDYLTKPFNKKELLARIRALIRAQKTEESQIGEVIFDKENLSLSNNGVTLYLSERESLFLAVLEQNKGETIPMSELKQKTGLSVDTDNNIIKLYISYLQSKFKVLDNHVTVFFSEIGCGLKC